MLPQRQVARRICVTAFIVLSLILSGHVQAKTTLKLAHVALENQAIGVGGERFARLLREVSGQTMDVEIFPRGVLGEISDLWVQMRAGTLDMQVIDIAAITLLNDARELQVLLTPFLFDDQAQLHAYLENSLFTVPMERVSRDTGIRYLGFVADRSPRVISTTKKPVVTVDDLKGLKIRVPSHPMYMRIFEYWGAIPTPMSPADMFMALKSGMVEGEDNGVINMVNGPNAEVIRHFTPVNWNRSVVAAWISEASWTRLTDQERAWVSEAIKRAQVEASVDYEREMQESMQKLEHYGIQVHTPDLAGFLPVRDKIMDQYEGTTWPAGQVGRIRSLK